MKGILSILFFSLALISFGQKQVPNSRERVVTVDTTLKPEFRTIDNVNTRLSLYGDFKVSDYIQIESKSLNPIELKLIKGSLVRIQKNSITGDEIDPMTFEIYEAEKMTSNDFIYRTTGSVPDSTYTGLPLSGYVHKTDHSECYGIMQLNNGQLALPYKGFILILERRP